MVPIATPAVEMDAGSREENASKTNNESFGSDSIRTEIALALSERLAFQRDLAVAYGKENE